MKGIWTADSVNVIFNWILQAKAVEFLGTLRNQRDIWERVLDQTLKVFKSKPYHPSYTGLVIGVHGLELRGGEGGVSWNQILLPWIPEVKQTPSEVVRQL